MPTFATPQPISLTVELGVGDIRIVASDRLDTAVDVRPSDPAKKSDVTAAAETHVEYADGRLLVRAPKGWRQYSLRDGGASIDVEVALPTGSSVRVRAGVAAVRSTGRLAACRCQTGVGDIHLEQAGPLEIKSGSGTITVERAFERTEVSTGSGAVQMGSIDGAAVIKNSNGDTWIGAAGGDLRVSAANGDISVDVAQTTVVAKTANGDVRLGEVARGAVLAETGCGQLDVGVRDGVAAWLDLNTHLGNVVNSLDNAHQPEAGEATVEVRARNAFGDITIRRALATHAGGPSA
jgi:hypothetical protein